MKKIIFILFSSLFLLSLFLLSQHLFQGDLFFDSDIGRDFLLFEDVLYNKPLTLIGPRADGISGMFFGPYWIYMNLPVFILSGGNPIAVGFSWFILMLISIGSVYYVSKKIFNLTAALATSLIYSFALVPFSSGFTQSFMAVILAPWLIYSLSLYMKKPKPLFLATTLFIVGVIYQFQPAFGMISIPATVGITLFYIIKNRKYKHIFYFIFLFLPFAAFILFEIKHNFIQTAAFMNHVFSKGENGIRFVELLKERIELLINIFNFSDYFIIGTLFFVIFLFIFYKTFLAEKSLYKNFYIIYFSYIICFFVISLLFKGRFNDYHTWGFLSITAIALGGIYKFINKKIYISIIFLVLIFTILAAVNYRIWWNDNFLGKDNLSWKSNEKVAEYIFNQEDSDFGFYIFSLDEFGYHMRYAINYLNRKNGSIGTFCVKKPTTYLIYYDQIKFSRVDPVYWKNSRVNIKKEPVKRIKIDNIIVEKYYLNASELNALSDPNLICNLHFR